MRFLVNENLSPQLCPYLTGAGDTAEHVHPAVGTGASDHESVAHATRQEAVIITADTDFGTLLAQQKTGEPSIVLVRELLSLPFSVRRDAHRGFGSPFCEVYFEGFTGHGGDRLALAVSAGLARNSGEKRKVTRSDPP